MAITTVDGILAGMQPRVFVGKALTGTMVAGRPWSTWALAGTTGVGTYDTTLAGVALSAPVNGQIPFDNPASGNTYLARFCGSATQAGQLLLVDRLWHNGGFTITSTSAQTVNSATFPARDRDGTTDGKGVLLGVEVSAACGAAAPTITVSYTNSAGTSSRSATNWFATANSPAAGSFFPIGLQAGDLGVRSVQSLTLSASWVSGTINLVAYRVLATANITAAWYQAGGEDWMQTGATRLYDSSVPSLIFVPSTTTTSNIMADIVYAQG